MPAIDAGAQTENLRADVKRLSIISKIMRPLNTPCSQTNLWTDWPALSLLML